ncbi:ankyrin repeat domain-containing protein [Deinococcus sp. KSM4-11]|uniref:ankyrin repeat domain-containing protein n=1 Tax=Deinococcus sp. KSM4-11 TaxID=2568654 RepID=UPI0010A2D85F|nr:ankyrin repeat domain-containing protein [Deinococcus sp. KSM4-11]THF84772.1 ankyrin repeat domain-containing protein [Deinococcus sp. KSM4-11]
MTTDAERELFLAIQANDGVQVRALVRGDPALLRAVSPMGVSPVLFATYYRKHDMAHVLIDEGATLDIFEAAAVGDAARVQALTAREAGLVSAVSADGFTPLGLAAFFGRAEVAQHLLERGADVNAVSRNPMRVQPLHSAVAGNHEALARLLVAAGAEVNAVQQDDFTPLMAAAQNGNAALVVFLLAAGAAAGAVTSDGRTAGSLAREEGHTEVMALLT